MGEWLSTGKGFYSELIGIGITAAGPLPLFTGFPFKPIRHLNNMVNYNLLAFKKVKDNKTKKP
jgi:hypothetical protein